MLTIAVANLKGGCGKTTIATNLAAHFARQGMRTVLADADRQRCALGWVELRGDALPAIEGVAVDREDLQAPRKAPYVVFDAPAGLRKREIEALADLADLLLVPVGPGSFDEAGTARFLEQVAEAKSVRKGRTRVAFVANRVRPRTVTSTRLEQFLGQLAHPTVARLSESQSYAAAAATGRGLTDLPSTRNKRLLAEWSPLFTYVNEVITSR